MTSEPLDTVVEEFLDNNKKVNQSMRTTVDLDRYEFTKFKLFCKSRGVSTGRLLDVFIKYINETKSEENK